MSSARRAPGAGRVTSTAAALAAALTCATLPAAHADPETPRTERVSTTSDGAQADGPSADPAISADGRHAGFTSTARGRAVVFGSDAADLVPNDTNGVSDVFVRHTR
ncbi:hypothetical protein H9W91_26690 [Streptomyces alfalfae]|uniref:hypothetical protein n=1 Tax=Streptomyces alfalfae TaxID=1642299 RepID=UPI001BADA255|nr:hypothetical protein [Streptomyces alfalfae]QUI34048.1 hypothetical protein H9W91_26690 [Streptomyces alfalfae]